MSETITTLRAFAQGAPAAGHLYITDTDARLLIDAIDIADECARADIECECIRHTIDGQHHYQRPPADHAPHEITSMLDASISYLQRRNLIEIAGEQIRFTEPAA